MLVRLFRAAGLQQAKEMNVDAAQKIDEAIAEQNGSVRDALCVALTRLEILKTENETLKELLKTSAADIPEPPAHKHDYSNGFYCSICGEQMF
jgi:hypothetical protein